MERDGLESVLQRAATGDADAFGTVVRRFQDLAVGYAFSLLGDFHLAEDAAQEAFLQAYQDLWQLRDPKAFPAWFRKLIFKHCDRLTRNKRLEIVPLESAATLASGEPDPFEAIEMREVNDRVHAAIRCLADHERAVMTLFYIGEYSHKEIGAFLDLPVTTIKKRLHDARKHLKERMVAMVHDNLQENRPSRDEQFVEQLFILGGTLPREAPSYVVRRADTELYEALKRGQFCWVLSSRQMGKSSLMVRTAVRLRDEGIASVLLDLTAVGLKSTPEEWYHALLSVIAGQLDLPDEVETFWQSHARRDPAEQWMAAIREMVLKVGKKEQGTGNRNDRVPYSLVIFIDEIDLVQSLPFSADGLFREIEGYDKRCAQDPELNRLTFCLLGVATAADLIEDGRTGFFDRAGHIELDDFTEADARPLAHRLARSEARGEELMRRVLYWTGGHPYLTQALCHAIADDESVTGSAGVDRLCEQRFFSPDTQDANLLFVRDRLLKTDEAGGKPLDVFARLVRGKRVHADPSDPLAIMLRLAGLARVEAGHLRIRNRIYERVFDWNWVQAHLQ
jgi:RNA polymerase sigma factor (sigma-70 family)